MLMSLLSIICPGGSFPISKQCIASVIAQLISFIFTILFYVFFSSLGCSQISWYFKIIQLNKSPNFFVDFNIFVMNSHQTSNHSCFKFLAFKYSSFCCLYSTNNISEAYGRTVPSSLGHRLLMEWNSLNDTETLPLD